MIGIRVDANAEIATGHVMRCLSIANEMRRKHIDCVFITADVFSEEIIQESGFDVILLKTPWNEMEKEIEELVRVIKKYAIERLIIDSYFVTVRYFDQIKIHTMIIYIDDMNLFQFPAAMIINYNIYAEKFSYPEIYHGADTKILLGCEYAPLRSEFDSVIPLFREKVDKILITTGGTDQLNAAGKLLGHITKEKIFEDIEFHVVLGRLNRYAHFYHELQAKNHLIVLHQDVTTMSALITSCDIAISAGGSTLYELCACGVPTICFSFADNQLFGVKGFEEAGLMTYAGDIRTGEEECINNLIKGIDKYIYHPELRKKRSDEMRKLVDGKGASRIVAAVMQI